MTQRIQNDPATPQHCIIDLMEEALYTLGTAADFGVPEDRLCEFWQVAQDLGTSKQITAVRDWQWWDLGDLNVAPLQPSVIYGADIIKSTDVMRQPGSGVFSTALLHFHHNSIFETRNTLYILVDNGTRKTVQASVVVNFYKQ